MVSVSDVLKKFRSLIGRKDLPPQFLSYDTTIELGTYQYYTSYYTVYNFYILLQVTFTSVCWRSGRLNSRNSPSCRWYILPTNESGSPSMTSSFLVWSTSCPSWRTLLGQWLLAMRKLRSLKQLNDSFQTSRTSAAGFMQQRTLKGSFKLLAWRRKLS